jgi:hypothetical protein
MRNATIVRRTRLNVTFIRRMSVLFPFGAVKKDLCICKPLLYRYIKKLIISLTELSHSVVNNRILCSEEAKFGIPPGYPNFLCSQTFAADLGYYLQIVYNFFSSVYLPQYTYCSTLHKRSRWKKLWNNSRNSQKLSFPRVSDKKCLHF